MAVKLTKRDWDNYSRKNVYARLGLAEAKMVAEPTNAVESRNKIKLDHQSGKTIWMFNKQLGY